MILTRIGRFAAGIVLIVRAVALVVGKRKTEMSSRLKCINRGVQIMYIVFRDTIGTIRIDDIDTITFLDGIAYFNAEN